MSQLFFLSTLSYQFWRIKLLTKTATIILRAPTRAPFMINELKVVYLYIFLKFVLYEDNWRNLKSLYYIIRDWQSRGREFEPHLLHFLFPRIIFYFWKYFLKATHFKSLTLQVIHINQN